MWGYMLRIYFFFTDRSAQIKEVWRPVHLLFLQVIWGMLFRCYSPSNPVAN